MNDKTKHRIGVVGLLSIAAVVVLFFVGVITWTMAEDLGWPLAIAITSVGVIAFALVILFMHWAANGENW